MSNYSEELIQKTIKVWSPKAGYTLSENEATEIIKNITEYFEVLDDIATNITDDISKEMIDGGDFIKIENIDKHVPDEKGLYCIRMIDNAELPKEYQLELEKRKNRLIYIGKAENKSLRQRFLKQELRAKGHGTFFRSVGAMLGYSPPKGSLKNKKNKDNYKFSKADELRIISWINSRLEASWLIFDGPFVIEKYLICKYRPLLNIQQNPDYLDILVKDRRRCKSIALGISC